MRKPGRKTVLWDAQSRVFLSLAVVKVCPCHTPLSGSRQAGKEGCCHAVMPGEQPPSVPGICLRDPGAMVSSQKQERTKELSTFYHERQTCPRRMFAGVTAFSVQSRLAGFLKGLGA